jgi:hypothetical protein
LHKDIEVAQIGAKKMASYSSTTMWSMHNAGVSEAYFDHTDLGWISQVTDKSYSSHSIDCVFVQSGIKRSDHPARS